MGFFDSLNKLIFGDNSSSNRQKEQYDKVADYDGRMNDFEVFSGEAINEMGNRGIINSSVTSKALSTALNQANDSYWDDQLKLAGYNYGKDTEGILPALSKGMTSFFKILG